MDTERTQVLEMLAAGKLTVAEAEMLLAALSRPAAEEMPDVATLKAAAKKDAGGPAAISDSFGPFDRPEGFAPVSYTHLDVYKRQPGHPRPPAPGRTVGRGSGGRITN